MNNSHVQSGETRSSYLNTAFVQSNQTTQQSIPFAITIEEFIDVNLIKTDDRLARAQGTYTVVSGTLDVQRLFTHEYCYLDEI